MRIFVAGLVFLFGSAGVSQGPFDEAQGGPPAAPDRPVPVLVELFTAEGCSSCPPADSLLAALLTSQPAAGVLIVGLGEHVDYWDRLGWKDRFSSAAFTRRQRLYAERFKSGDIYTPQMVVDGETAFVGSDLEAARRAIERAGAAPRGVVRLEVDSSVTRRVTVNVTPSGLSRAESRDPSRAESRDERSDVIVAIVEDGLSTDVQRGENKGRKLTHAAVVREMVTAGEVSADGATVRAEIAIGQDWRREQLKVVAFVQERKSRRILAAATAPLN